MIAKIYSFPGSFFCEKPFVDKVYLQLYLLTKEIHLQKWRYECDRNDNDPNKIIAYTYKNLIHVS